MTKRLGSEHQFAGSPSVCRPARLFGAAALLVVALGCRFGPQSPPIRVDKEEWPAGGPSGTRLRTEHWDIRTTVRDEGFHDLLPEFMETTYGQYEKLFPNMEKRNKRRLRVYLFQTRNEWEAFSADRFPHKVHLYRKIRQGAYCEKDVPVAYYLGRARTLSVLAHEGLHAYVHRHFRGQLPAWLNEGLATYCECYEYDEHGPKFTPRQNEFRLNSLRDALLRKTLIPLRELLGTHAGKVIQGTSPGVYAYYSQAWALMVYLRYGEREKYARRFESLLQDLGTERLRVGAGAYVAATKARDGEPMPFGEAVFRKYITEDVAAFEEGFEKYLVKIASLR